MSHLVSSITPSSDFERLTAIDDETPLNDTRSISQISISTLLNPNELNSPTEISEDCEAVTQNLTHIQLPALTELDRLNLLAVMASLKNISHDNYYYSRGTYKPNFCTYTTAASCKKPKQMHYVLVLQYT